MKQLATGLVFGSFICLAAFWSATPVRADDAREFSAEKKRPRVTIYPRRVYPGPYAKRECYSWLRTEYRPSGTVVTPQMRCWWE